jgi:predicted RNA-binding Zn ribbon-like protein
VSTSGKQVATPESINLFGGALCLDFANSVDWTDAGEPLRPDVTDALAEPDALARWGRRVGLPAQGQGRYGELAAAFILRRDLHRIFSAIARGDAPGGDELYRLGRSHAEAAAGARLERDGSVWRLAWQPLDVRLVRLAVAVDAVALLGDAERPARVRRCPGRDCGWLFLDTSGRRRWYSMGTCGSRAKMRRLYARQRAARATERTG